MEDFYQVTSGVAKVLEAIAWPGVTLFLLLRYRDHVGRLIDRLRKGGPAEFDPLPPAQQGAPDALALAQAVGPNPLAQIRSAAVVKMEEAITALPFVTEAKTPLQREAMLLTLAAKAMLLSVFERTEGLIYASQVELLNYLNARPAGESADTLKAKFYEPATHRFPEIYREYPFESYLGFLSTSMMVSLDNVLRVTITQQGVEYLMWRVEQKKPPRLLG